MRALLCTVFLCLLAIAAQADDDIAYPPDPSSPAEQAASDAAVAAGDSPSSDQVPFESQSGGTETKDRGALAETQPPAAKPGTSDAGVYRLGEVVVIGNPEVGAAGQTMSTVNEQNIEDRNARTLDEALQQLPGIDIRLRKEGVPRLDIRGLPPRHVPLFLNGVPINAASDGQFDPSLIPTENIAEVNVFRGTSSVLYGPGALGGVVDIVTKKGSGGPSAGFSGETGQGAERLVRGTVSGAAEGFDGFISGSNFTTDGYPVADDGLRDNSDKTRINVFINGGYAPNDQWQFGVNFGYIKGSQGIPPSTINNSKNIFASTPKFERLDDIEGHSGEFDARYAPTRSVDFRATGYFNQLNKEDDIYDDANYDTMTNRKVKTQHVHNDDTVVGGQMQSNFDFGEAGLVTLGLIAKDETSNNTGEIRDVAAGGGNFRFRDLDNDDSIQTYSTALQYVVAPLPRTHAVLGVAHHWFSQAGQSVRNDDQAMGSLGYDIFSDLRFNVATSRDVRFPSVQELFDPSQGNPNLLPEKSVNYQAGFDWTLVDRSHVELTGFRNRVNGFIQNDKTTNRFANNNALFKGVEIAYRAVVFDTLAFRTAYSFLEATASQSNGFNGRLDLRPKHKIDFQAVYNFAPEWQAYLDATYLANQVVSSRTLPVQQESLANYALVDGKISRSFLHDSLAVYVGVNNIFDQKSDIGPGFPLEGRFVYGGIRTRI